MVDLVIWFLIYLQFLLEQGVYYYFYQIFRNKAEVAALERSKMGIGDGSVGMLSSLVVAALSGYFLCSYDSVPHGIYSFLIYSKL